MQLHLLGPAFGLPSIDAECLAAVALLQLHRPAGWSIVLSDSLTQAVPLLTDGSERVEGFKDIARYLSQHHCTNLSAQNTNEQQSADATALTSFLHTHAQLLLDISLYVSYENYSTTRTAFTKILPWYSNYIVPLRRREDARTRTAHLGISSVDVDDVDQDTGSREGGGFDASVGKEKAFEADAKQRASLLLPNKRTVRSLLGRPEHSAAFKLHALADNFFGPLEEMLGDSTYFLSTSEPQAIDCLVYGYLALMLYPPLPQNWLVGTMRRKYGKLVRWTEKMHKTLKMGVDVDAVLAVVQCKTRQEAEDVRQRSDIELPFAPSPATNVMDVTKSIVDDLAARVPLLGPTRTQLIPLQPRNLPFYHHPSFPAILAATAASIAASAYYAFTTGLLVWPRGDAIQIFGRRKLSDYGDLGAALAGISLLGSQQANDEVTVRPQSVTDNPVRVEVELEKDGLP